MKSDVRCWIRSRDLPVCRPASYHVAMSDSEGGYLHLYRSDRDLVDRSVSLLLVVLELWTVGDVTRQP